MDSNLLCGTLSNALLRSKNTAQTSTPDSSALCHECVADNSAPVIVRKNLLAALDAYSDQTRKYGISKSIIQADFVVIIIGLVLWIQKCHTFSFGHYHQAPGASCGILYYPGLASCPFYAIPINYTLSNL